MTRTKPNARPRARDTASKAATANAGKPATTASAKQHAPAQAATKPTKAAMRAAVRATPMPAHIGRARGDSAGEGGTGGTGGQAEPEWARDAKMAATSLSRGPKKNGRPRFEPTADQRRQVETLAGFGLPQPGIASLIKNPHTGKGINEETLRQHFEHELAEGVSKANSAVGQSLFQKATGNGHQSVAAAIFWLKCRAGWRERVDVAVDIKGGVLIPPSSMTPEQWIATQAAINASRTEPGKAE